MSRLRTMMEGSLPQTFKMRGLLRSLKMEQNG